MVGGGGSLHILGKQPHPPPGGGGGGEVAFLVYVRIAKIKYQAGVYVGIAKIKYQAGVYMYV